MNRRLFSHVAMSATIASVTAAHATDWWLYMAREDRCVEAAQGDLRLGSFTASPEALIKYY